ncbi:MAG TPA: dickkopf-related protein [Candidatus Babeliales bacterium]|nr:dickkopf-related protein [Candidatus Babeliales bacterium]
MAEFALLAKNLANSMILRLFIVSLAKSFGVLAVTTTPAIGVSCASAADCGSNLVCDLTLGSCQTCIANSTDTSPGHKTCSSTALCCGNGSCNNGICESQPLGVGATWAILGGGLTVGLGALWLAITTSADRVTVTRTAFTPSNALRILSADTAMAGIGITDVDNAGLIAAIQAVGAAGAGPENIAATVTANGQVRTSLPTSGQIAAVQAVTGGSSSGGATALVVAATQQYIADYLAPQAKAALSSFSAIDSVEDALIEDTSGYFAKLLLAQTICTASDAANFVAAIQETTTVGDFKVVFTDAAMASARVAQPGALLKALLNSNFIASIQPGGTRGNLNPTVINKKVIIARAYAASNNTQALSLIENLGGFSFEDIDFNNLSSAETDAIATGVARVQMIFNGAGFSTDENGFPLDGNLNFFSE